MPARSRGVRVGRRLPRRNFLALVISTAIALLVLAPVTAGAADPGGAGTFRHQRPGAVVPEAGHVRATLLAPQLSRHSAAPHSPAFHTMNPKALAAAKLKANAAAQQTSGTGTSTAPAKPSVGGIFNGLDNSGLSAADEGNVATPPDSTGSIGPTRYVEFVNNLVGVYDRTNLAALSRVDLGSFARTPAGVSTSDPQIQWDPQSSRWLYALVGIATGSNYLLFGWSKTGDPSDLANGWCQYGIPTGSNLQDYPKLGHDANFVTVGSNIYDDSKTGFPFVSANVWAIPKPAAADSTCSSPVTATFFADATHVIKNSDGTPAFTPVPANTSDTGVNDYIVAAHDVSVSASTKAMLWHMEARPGPVLVADGDISVGSSYSVPPAAPQPGTSYHVDTLDGRFTQAVAHFDPKAGAEGLWTQQTVAGSGRSVVRWYEFLPTLKKIYQQGQLQSSTDFYWNAAISPSSAGSDAAIFYNRGSSSLLAVIGGQTRSSTTSLGQMATGEVLLGSSSAADQESAFPTNCTTNPCRWGDYSGATPDPNNPGVVWGSNQITGPVFLGYAQWQTQNFAVMTGPPAPNFSLSASPSTQTVIKGAGTSYAVTITPANGFTGTVTLTIGGLPSGATGSFAPNPTTSTSSTLTVGTSTGTTPGTYPLTITGTNGSLTRTTGVTLVVKPSTFFTLGVSPGSQTVAQGAATSYAISITPTGGFTGSVTLAVSGLPSGAAGSFTPNPAPGTTSTLNVTTVASTPVGTYPLNITGTSGSLTDTTSATLVVSVPPPCASASLSPATSSQPAGSTVGFTASSTGCPNPVYEFWLQTLDGSWNITRGFSADPTWTWNTGVLAPGTYTVHVWANQLGDSTDRWEAYGSSTVALTGCTSASLTVSPSSPQPAGIQVQFAATSSGCSNPVYEFWLQDTSGGWSMKQAFGASATWSWDTTGYPSGAYTVHVWANQAGGTTSTWQAFGELKYTLGSITPPPPPAPCSSASLSPASPSQPAGSTVSFTASSTGCPNPVYEYWVGYPNGNWSMQRAFSTDPTWSWSTAGLAPGTYSVHVWANQAGDSTASWEAYGSSTIALTGCTSALISPATGSGPAGNPVIFTASSSGCPNPIYEFWLQDTSGGWQMVQVFGTGATWQWNTAGLPAGTYNVHVWANQQGADTSTWETYGSATFTLS